MFKTMTSVLNKQKTPSDEEIRKIQPYIFCRWLSGNPGTIPAANQLNRYYNIPIENQYKMIKEAFAGKIKFIPFPKNSTEDVLKEIVYISRHFNINLEKAKEYLELISPEELREIVDAYAELELKGK